MINFSEPIFLILIVFALPPIYLIASKDSRTKRIASGLKAATIITISLALASPAITIMEERNPDDKLIILEDNSRSTEILDKPDLGLDNIETERVSIASGNSSDLSSGILQNVEEDRSYLLISDLQSQDLGDPVVDEINRKNSTINILKLDSETESSVTVGGPETTYPGTENTFTVDVTSTSNVPLPSVRLNGESVELERLDNDTWEFEETFDEEGYNTIEASINLDDKFRDNNNYYKTVKVAEKPEIFVLGEEGRIGQEFDNYYDFTYSDTIPENVDDYYSVIAKEDFNEENLASYVSRGNGLIYTGELESDNSILPIRKTELEDKGITMMLLIDASQGTGGECIEGSEDFCFERESEGGALERTQKISYLLLDSETLPPGSKVGALYYNSQPTLISEPRPLGENNHREKLQGGITNIPTGGNSIHHRAIRAGQEVVDGEGNLMLITDGKITALGEYYNDTRNSRELAESSEQKIISIMVGQEPNQNYLEDISSLSGGYSISDVKSQELQFQGGGASSEAVSLIKNNENHFITSGINLESSTSGFVGSEPKSGAKQLVSGSNSEPFLTTWRYGLGRVAAYSAGQKDLGALMFRDSEIVSRTLSWSIGDPLRKRNNSIKIEDGQIGNEVRIESPNAIEGLTRERQNLYTAEVRPNNTGFHRFKDAVYSYNYNDEVEDIGYKDSEYLASETGGKVFRPDQTQEIKDSVQKFNSKRVSVQKDLSNYFIVLGLIIFLSEIGYRKRRGKK